MNMFDLIRSRRSFFDDFFDDFGKTTKGVMNTDIIETDKSYTFNVELPGFKKEDIKVAINNNYLIVEATRNAEETSENDKYLIREISHGSFRRSYYVGNASNDQLKAKYDNGILKIELEKSDKEKTQYIEVE